MVLTIEALDSVGMVDNWILGRADLRLRFPSGIYCAFPTHCGRMCAYSELMVMMAMVMMVMIADGDDGDGVDGDGDVGDSDNDGVSSGDHSSRST